MRGRQTACCFTGHRPGKLPWGMNEEDQRCVDLKNRLWDAVETAYEEGMRHFLCGMALGCDMYFAEAVLRLRRLHPDVTLEAAIPCASQADRWATADRERYKTLLACCDEQHLVQQGYSPNCMQRRNEYMVDHSALLLSAFAGLPGGTMNTILYAQRSGVETVVIGI